MEFGTYFLYGPSSVSKIYKPHYLAALKRSIVDEGIRQGLPKMPLGEWKKLRWQSALMALFASSVSVGCGYLKHHWKAIPLGANIVTIGAGSIFAIIGVASVVRTVQAHFSIRQIHRIFNNNS